MGEIRLICPDCATVYQVPEAAIPAGGRDVECSECGQAWRAFNPALTETASEPQQVVAPPPVVPPPAPIEQALSGAQKTVPLDQRLPPNVLNILREAVETERRARHGTDQPPSNGLPDIDWPATTITETARAAREPDHPPMPQPEPVAPPPPAPAAVEQPAIADAQPDIPAAQPMQAAPVAAQSSGYLIGMGLSAMLAAALVAAYVMAPRMADAGELGAALMDLRQHIDGARLWLDGLIR